MMRPDPLCQFTDARGRSWPPTTWPDGTSRDYDHVNCGPTSAAWLLAHQTAGARTSTPPEMRRRTGDRLGGTSTLSLAKAIEGAGGDVTYRSALPSERLWDLLAFERVAILLYHDYEYLRGESTFDPTFDGDHFMVLVGGTLSEAAELAPVTVLAMDPIGEMRNGKRRAAWNTVRLSQAVKGATSAAFAAGAPPDTVRCIVSWQKVPATPDAGDELARLRTRLAFWRERAEQREDATAEAVALLEQAMDLLRVVPALEAPE